MFPSKKRFGGRAVKSAQDCFPRPGGRANVQSFSILKAGMVACLAMLASGIATTVAAPAPAPVRCALTVGDVTVQAEVAETAAMRQRGLSGRAAGADDVAMLFAFPRPESPCFWMKNTALSLILVFIDAQGVIRQRAALRPNDERRVCARQPIRWALEVTAHSPGAQQLQVGQQVHGLPKPARPQRQPPRWPR